MVVELRKRKAPPAEAQPVRAKAAKTAKPKAKAEPKAKISESSSKVPVPKAGETISLKEFGGEIQTNDGETTSLEALVAASKAGVVIFTYPKASTPGCKLYANALHNRRRYHFCSAIPFRYSSQIPSTNADFFVQAPSKLVCSVTNMSL